MEPEVEPEEASEEPATDQRLGYWLWTDLKGLVTELAAQTGGVQSEEAHLELGVELELWDRVPIPGELGI